jgi:chromosomal replication initiation ATPase DnaA
MSKLADNREAMRAIFRHVARDHELTEADLYVRDRTAPVAEARACAMRACYDEGFSSPEIASLAGWDVTTVRRAITQLGCAMRPLGRHAKSK